MTSVYITDLSQEELFAIDLYECEEPMISTRRKLAIIEDSFFTIYPTHTSRILFDGKCVGHCLTCKYCPECNIEEVHIIFNNNKPCILKLKSGHKIDKVKYIKIGLEMEELRRMIQCRKGREKLHELWQLVASKFN